MCYIIRSDDFGALPGGAKDPVKTLADFLDYGDYVILLLNKAYFIFELKYRDFGMIMKSSFRRTKRIPAAYALELGKDALLRYYMKDLIFSKQFQDCLEKHEAEICKFLLGSPDVQISEQYASGDPEVAEIVEALDRVYPGFLRHQEIAVKIVEVLSSEEAASNNGLKELLNRYFPTAYVGDLVELVNDLNNLAINNGLDYPWTVSRLMLIALAKMEHDVSSPNDSTLELLVRLAAKQLEKSGDILPLTITVPAFIVLWLPEKDVLEYVKDQLHAYKNSLASRGVSFDTRDALERHVYWLFLSKRHKFTAKEILEEEEHTSDTEVGYTHIADAIEKLDRDFGGSVRKTRSGYRRQKRG
jgi:hypothetical protein